VHALADQEGGFLGLFDGKPELEGYEGLHKACGVRKDQREIIASRRDNETYYWLVFCIEQLMLRDMRIPGL
jgi:hypothetical protein